MDHTGSGSANSRDTCGEIIIVCNIIFNVLALVIVSIEIAMKLYQAYKIAKEKKGKGKWVEILLLYFEKDGLEVKDRGQPEEEQQEIEPKEPHEGHTPLNIVEKEEKEDETNIKLDLTPSDAQPLTKKPTCPTLFQVDEPDRKPSKIYSTLEIVMPETDSQLTPPSNLAGPDSENTSPINSLFPLKRPGLPKLRLKWYGKETLNTIEDPDVKKTGLSNASLVFSENPAPTPLKQRNMIPKLKLKGGWYPGGINGLEDPDIKKTDLSQASEVFKESNVGDSFYAAGDGQGLLLSVTKRLLSGRSFFRKPDTPNHQSGDESAVQVDTSRPILRHSESHEVKHFDRSQSMKNDLLKEAGDQLPGDKKNLRLFPNDRNKFSGRRKDKLATIKAASFQEDVKDSLSDIKDDDIKDREN